MFQIHPTPTSLSTPILIKKNFYAVLAAELFSLALSLLLNDKPFSLYITTKIFFSSSAILLFKEQRALYLQIAASIIYLAFLIASPFVIGAMPGLITLFLGVIISNVLLLGRHPIQKWISFGAAVCGLIFFTLIEIYRISPNPNNYIINPLLFIIVSVYVISIGWYWIWINENIQNRLNESNAFLSNILQHNPNLIFAKDLEGRFTLLNRQCTQFTGYEADKMLGKFEEEMGLSVPDLPPELADYRIIDNQVITDRKEVFIPRIRLQNRLGENRWFQAVKAPFYKENKEIQGLVGTLTDITDIVSKEAALIESEERFRIFFENSPFGIAIRDFSTNRLIDTNPRMEEMFGYSKSELFEIQRNNLTLWEDLDALEKNIERIRKGEVKNFTSEKKYLRKDGTSFWAKITRTLVHISQVPYLIGFIEDINDQKLSEFALMESEERFRRIFDESPLAIAIRDAHTEAYLSINPMFTQLLGYDEQEIIGRHRNALIAWENKLIYVQKKSELLAGSITGFSMDKILRKKSGEEIWVNTTLSAITVNNNKNIIVLMHDVTEKKQNEKLIQQALKELNEKNLSLRKYIDSNMQLESFAYIASHDLREPLLTVIGFCKVLEKKTYQKLDEKERQYLQFIQSATLNMDRLIRDLLTFARINTDQPKHEPIKIRLLLEQILNELKVSIDRRGVEVALMGLPENILGDETQIKQLFQNLISNAIKFSAQQRPKVTIGGIEEENEWTFYIEDNGIGIAPEFQEKIFLLFRRLKGINDKNSGTGIGLAVCKKVVENHGGKIWVESEEGKGAKFNFTLSKTINGYNILGASSEKVPLSL